MLTGLLRCGLIFLCSLLMTAEAAAPRIVLIYNGGQEVFQQFAEALMPLLKTQGQTLERHDSRNWSNGDPPASLQGVDLIIAAGSEVTALLAKNPPRAAVLCVLLSRQQFEHYLPALQHSERAVSAIYQDPPAYRQLLLAQLLLPDIGSVGYLYQPHESDRLPLLTASSRQLGLKLIAQPVAADAELPAALVSVIGQSSILLASADSVLYNRYTIKTILTAAYRQEKVVIGSSPAFVKAGSLATTYSNVGHIATQVAELLVTRIDRELPSAGYARYFQVSVNVDVARSLAIPLPDPDTLNQMMIARVNADEKAGVDHE